MPTKLDQLAVLNPKGRCLARVGLSITFFINQSLHELAPAIVPVLAQYLQYAGEDRLQAYFNDEGWAKPLTQRQLNKDVGRLQKVNADTKAIILEYGSDPSGWVGDYGFVFNGADFSHYLYEGERTNYVRMDFPADFLEQAGPESLPTLLHNVTGLMPVEFAQAGFTFQRSAATQGDSTRMVNRALPRYLGIDPGYKDVMDDMRGHTLSAQWLNFLGPGLMAKLQGETAIRQALPEADVRPCQGGIFIRGCEFPPLGDINHGAPDIGLLPAVARLLQPLRADIPAFGEPSEKFDGSQWMARFDALDNRPWQNRQHYQALLT